MGARGRRQHEGAVGDGGFEAVVEHRAVEDAVGASRHHRRLVVWPALPRLDQAQPRQAEIRHGARRGADILAKLRLDQHDDGRRALRANSWSCRSRRPASVHPGPGPWVRKLRPETSAPVIANRTTKRQCDMCNCRLSPPAAGAIGRAPNSRQSDSRLAMSAPRTIHLRAREEKPSTAPIDVQFPVGPNKHGDQRCKHARSRNHVDKGR